MPIALYPELALSLVCLAKRLADWVRLAPLEEQLLRRARGAFLVHWFGPLVPEHRLNLLIAIDNIAALQARLAQAKASMPGPEAEMNLLRPMAAVAGTWLGIAFSPVGSLLIGLHPGAFLGLLEVCGLGIVWRIILLVTSLVPGANLGLMLLIGLPAILGTSLAFAIGGNPELRAGYSLMGDLAMLVDAFLAFWAQLTGPEDKIRNPVLRRLVVLANRVAGLFAQLLGFVAFIVVKVVPLVPSLVEQWRAIKALGEETFGVAGEVLSDFVDALMEPFGEQSIPNLIRGLFAALAALPGLVVSTVMQLVEDSVTELGYAATALSDKLSEFVSGLASRISKAFKTTPLGEMVGRISAFVRELPLIRAAFAGIGSGPPDDSGGSPNKAAGLQDTLSGFWVALGLGTVDEVAEMLPGERAGTRVGTQVGSKVADAIGAARALTLPKTPGITLPAIPALPDFPDSVALHSKIGAPAPHDLVHDATKLFAEESARESSRKLPAALTRRPRSAFADLLKENAAPAAPDAQQLAVRDAIYAAVGRVLPAALRIYAPKLRAAFDALDQHVYGLAPTAGAQTGLPQQDLPDSGLLRPIVETLAIRAPTGTDTPDLYAFRNMVTEALRAQTYRAVDTASVMGGGR